MMRNLTDEEFKLMDMLHNDKSLTEQDKQKILHRLDEIEQSELGDCPFVH